MDYRNMGIRGTTTRKIRPQYPPSGPSEPAEAGSLNPLIGRKVRTRWADDNQFYDAVIADYNAIEGLHALVYDINTANETWEWVNLSKISPEDILWEDEDSRISRDVAKVGSDHGMDTPIGHDNVRE
ncbi:hypothetical protein ACH5RR_000665 [Cinchona calisaya]|uniref:Uncharacterized protein n=1 Tax=Cinchona calisaya TaxID=153742 RepID=A0ABD3B1A8_9GENT